MGFQVFWYFTFITVLKRLKTIKKLNYCNNQLDVEFYDYLREKKSFIYLKIILKCFTEYTVCQNGKTNKEIPKILIIILIIKVR